MKNLVRLFLLSAATLAAQSVTINQVPSREFGHPKLPSGFSTAFQFSSAKENYVEGRELSSPLSIAFDNSVSPAIVYVADTLNNRVLAWRSASSVSIANFADKVIGQNDLFSTNQGGPGTPLTSGLFLPTAVAVDSKGNLYVADSGNNRILRYPTPFSQTSGFQPVDLVIGQKTVSSGSSANQGQQKPSQKTISLNPGSLYTTSMTFDAQGNLWVADPGNNRVLRFPVSSLTAGTSEPSADVVLGQVDFTSNGTPAGFTQRNKNGLAIPSGLAFDQTGRLYVTDGGARVLQYLPPFNIGNSAARVLGVAQLVAGQTTVYPTQYTLGNTTGGSPNGVFTIGNKVFVIDTPQHRIVGYDDPANWAPESDLTFSPLQQTVIGQTDFNSGKPNHGANQSDGSSFVSPQAAAVFNNGAEIWVADSGNNRIVALPNIGGERFNQATRLLGQLDYIYGASNLVEGKELFLRSSSLTAGGVVIDSSPGHAPYLYVADTFNNRVLGFKDARQVGTDSRNLLTTKADLVIGQPDLLHSRLNFPDSDSTKQNDTGLNGPIGLAVDKNGNLWVADSGNGRVIRFPSPFSQSTQRANLVLGQASLFTKSTDATAFTMNGPFGVALFSDGNLAVSDAIHNRILLFQKSSGDFTSGQAASIVLGQSGFNSTASGNGLSSLNSPRHIATDSSDRLYVADSANNRMLVFTRGSQANGAAASLELPGLSSPQGVFISTLTGEIWVTNSGNGQILRFPEFQTLQLNGPTSTAVLAASGPVAITLDAFDNVVALEGSNRMTFYFASLAYRHLGTYNQSPMAPGMLAALFLGPLDNSSGSAFKNLADASAQSYPWPTTLSDVQVQVNGKPAPIFKIQSGLIYFQVPSSAPCGCNGEANNADFVVSRPSTGQILASATFNMRQASPGFFTSNAAGTGQISATNEDGSVNGPSNQVPRGKYITLYLTGAGRVPGGPDDGMPPTGAPVIPGVTSVLMTPGPGSLPASALLYSGLGAFPGGWQINVTIPDSASGGVPPSPAITTVVTLYDIPSNVGPGGQRIVTTIATK